MRKLSQAEIIRQRAARQFKKAYAEEIDFEYEAIPKEEAFPGDVKGRVAQVNGLYRTNWFNGRFLTAEALRADQVYADTRSRLVAQIHPAGVAWGLTLELLDSVKLEHKGSTTPTPPSDDAEVMAQLERLCKRHHEADGDEGIEKELRESVEKLKIEWEDFLAWCDPTAAPDATGGWDVGTRVRLAPGLAFDDLGRPASVGAAFTFRFTDLIQRYRTRPSVVIGGGTTFTPCACIEELPPGSVPTGASLPEGPYLLLIFPIEVGEGKARVYGDACASTGSAEACEAEGWRGGFELRLARLKIEVPQESWTDAWDLRGMISGWYFDLYEHDLRTRWNRAGATAAYFPADPAQWQGPGPNARVEAGVPLALTYIGSDGSVLFLDEWIPRRPIAAPGSAAWGANARGAPTPAARIARLHQFQTMLNESVADSAQFGKSVAPRNLYERGFRHIPPWGFLPIPEPPPLIEGERLMMNLFFSEAKAIEAAKEAATTWFAGTNVVPIFHVAIHDDDLFEDMRDADEKDPVSLQLRDKGLLTAKLFACLSKGDAKQGGALLLQLGLKLLAAIARHFGDLTVEALVNREVEVVKVIIPMEPKRRSFPIVGRVSDDPLTGLFAAWSKVKTNDKISELYDLWFGDILGTAAAPRRFVLYVKQRMVLLDLLYLVLDFVLDLLAIAEVVLKDWIEKCADDQQIVKPVDGQTHKMVPAAAMVSNSFLPYADRDSSASAFTTEQLKVLAAPLKARVADTARAVLNTDGAREIAATALRSTFPELALPGTWSAYKEEVRKGGTDGAIAALATEHRGFGALKAVSLILPDQEVNSLVATLATTRAASGQGELGPAAPIVTNTFNAHGYARPEAEAEVYAAARAAYGDKPATDLVEGAPAAVRVDDLLAGTLDDAARKVGRTAAPTVSARITKDARVINDAAKAVAAAPAARTEAFWKEVDAAKGENGDLVSALGKVAKEGSPAAKAASDAILKTMPALGKHGVEAFAGRLRTKSDG